MTHRFAARAAAISLAALVTLVMLGSVDFLATSHPNAAAMMAAASQPRA